MAGLVGQNYLENSKSQGIALSSSKSDDEGLFECQKDPARMMTRSRPGYGKVPYSTLPPHCYSVLYNWSAAKMRLALHADSPTWD